MKEKFGKEVVCSCEECKDMCRYRPCWGTPEELQKIIDAGFGNRLMYDYWSGDGRNGGNIDLLCGAIKGREGGSAPFIPTGECTFLDKNGLCELHTLGLKPVEGRVADCKNDIGYDTHKKVAFTWNNKKAEKIVEKWRENFQ